VLLASVQSSRVRGNYGSGGHPTDRALPSPQPNIFTGVTYSYHSREFPDYLLAKELPRSCVLDSAFAYGGSNSDYSYFMEIALP